MSLIFIAAAALVVLALVVVKIAMGRDEAAGAEDARGRRMIHMSGIYSILRESPRGALAALRPNEEQIRKYLAGINVDVNGNTIDGCGREALVKHWKAQTEYCLREIEAGDKGGVVFYYYDHPRDCPACIGFITKGNIVTREEIYRHPRIIPPFHLGCNFVLSAHHGSDNLRETTTAGMAPFFDGEDPPPLPEWTNVVSLSAPAEAKT